MKSLFRHQILLVAVAAAVFFTNLGGIRLWDRDEPRNAGCAAEMLAADDWVVPVFNGELRDHKPVLLYWLIMLAYEVFGVNEFAARFASAVCGIGTVLATYHIGRRMFHPNVGLWAGIILVSTLMYGVVARAATPDSVLILCTTLSLLAYATAVFHPEDQSATGGQAVPEPGFFPSSRWTLLGMYGLMGFGVLAKGPVGLVMPTAIIGMFLLVVRLPEREPLAVDCGKWRTRFRAVSGLLRPFAPLHFLRTAWSMRPLTAIAAASVVALPWYIWVGVRTHGAFLEGFFLTHNLSRAMSPMEGHRGPVIYYLVALFLGFLPWSVFFGPTSVDLVRRLRRGDRWNAGFVFLLCWVGVYLIIFTLARTKLPNYIVPAYPAVALIVGSFIHHWTQNGLLVPESGPRSSWAGLVVVGLIAVAALPIAAWFYLPGEEWLAIIGLIPLAGAAIGLTLHRRGRFMASAASFAAVAVLFVTSVLALVADRVDRHQTVDRLLAAIDRAGGPTARIATFGCQEPSWIFYARRPIHLINAQNRDEVARFLTSDAGQYVITTEELYGSVKPQLPPEIAVLERTPYFLRRKNLVVLGRDRGGEQTAWRGSLDPRGAKLN